MSLLLRHRPEQAGLSLDQDGWCELTQLFANTSFTLAEIEEIVATDEKGRYSLQYWEMDLGDDVESTREPIRIRANQGHSTTAVSLKHREGLPPPYLYHGTSENAVEAILKDGIKSMSRHHVHLSDDVVVAARVGARHGTAVVMIIRADQMVADGIKFFISENGVWLVDAVAAKYIEKVIK